jgi:hypothetical protein
VEVEAAIKQQKPAKRPRLLRPALVELSVAGICARDANGMTLVWYGTEAGAGLEQDALAGRWEEMVHRGQPVGKKETRWSDEMPLSAVKRTFNMEEGMLPFEIRQYIRASEYDISSDS